MSLVDMDKILNYMNNSKVFTGIMMICLNVGSKYISIDFTKNHLAFFNSTFFRRLVVFTIVFVATKDIKISVLLTIVYTLIVAHFTHGKSTLCVLPSYLADLDLNDDGIISPEEIENAYLLLRKAGKLKHTPVSEETNYTVK